MELQSPLVTRRQGRIDAAELLRALRGIWELNAQELVVEVDQETGDLIACTYEAEDVDPRSVITMGTQVRPFERWSSPH